MIFSLIDFRGMLISPAFLRYFQVGTAIEKETGSEANSAHGGSMGHGMVSQQ